MDDEYFIEFIDIGAHKRYELSRKVFYDGLHGVSPSCLVSPGR